MQQWTAACPTCVCCLDFKGSVCRLAHMIQRDVHMPASPAGRMFTADPGWSNRTNTSSVLIRVLKCTATTKTDRSSLQGSADQISCSWWRRPTFLSAPDGLHSKYLTSDCVLWPPVSSWHQRGVISYSSCYSDCSGTNTAEPSGPAQAYKLSSDICVSVRSVTDVSALKMFFRLHVKLLMTRRWQLDSCFLVLSWLDACGLW